MRTGEHQSIELWNVNFDKGWQPWGLCGSSQQHDTNVIIKGGNYKRILRTGFGFDKDQDNSTKFWGLKATNKRKCANALGCRIILFVFRERDSVVIIELYMSGYKNQC